MRKWNTTITLSDHGSSIKVGDEKLKVVHICKRSEVHTTKKQLTITSELTEFLLNNPQKTEDDTASLKKILRLVDEKPNVRKKIRELEEKSILDQNVKMKGRIIKGAYVPLPDKDGFKREQIVRKLSDTWGTEPKWPRTNNDISKTIRRLRDEGEFTIILPYRTRAYWWRDVIDRIIDLPIPIPTSKPDVRLSGL